MVMKILCFRKNDWPMDIHLFDHLLSLFNIFFFLIVVSFAHFLVFPSCESVNVYCSCFTMTTLLKAHFCKDSLLEYVLLEV